MAINYGWICHERERGLAGVQHLGFLKALYDVREPQSFFFSLSLFLSKSKLLIFNGSESLLSFRVLFRSDRILSFLSYCFRRLWQVVDFCIFHVTISYLLRILSCTHTLSFVPVFRSMIPMTATPPLLYIDPHCERDEMQGRVWNIQKLLSFFFKPPSAPSLRPPYHLHRR